MDQLKRAEEAFAGFCQKSGSGVVHERELPTIIRASGLYLSQAQIDELMEQMKTTAGRASDDEDTSVNWATFNQVISAYVAAHRKETKRAGYLQILRALQTLDSQGQGCFSPEEVMAMFTTRGEQFSAEEAGAMLSAALDDRTHKVYVEDFAALLAR